MRTVVCVASLLAACATSPPAPAPLRLADIESAVFDHYRPAARNAVDRWSITISGERCRAFAPLLATAVRMPEPPTRLNIMTMHGVLDTARGRWSVAIAEHKIADQTVGITVQPLGDPAGREAMYVQLAQQPGRALLRELQQTLRDEAAKVPPTEPAPPPFHPVKELCDAFVRHAQRTADGR